MDKTKRIKRLSEGAKAKIAERAQALAELRHQIARDVARDVNRKLRYSIEYRQDTRDMLEGRIWFQLTAARPRMPDPCKARVVSEIMDMLTLHDPFVSVDTDA